MAKRPMHTAKETDLMNVIIWSILLTTGGGTFLSIPINFTTCTQGSYSHSLSITINLPPMHTVLIHIVEHSHQFYRLYTRFTTDNDLINTNTRRAHRVNQRVDFNSRLSTKFRHWSVLVQLSLQGVTLIPQPV